MRLVGGAETLPEINMDESRAILECSVLKDSHPLDGVAGLAQ